MVITFKVNNLPKNDDVSIDFRGLNIYDFKVNGKKCETTFHDHKIRLPSANLKLGQINKAQLYFLNMYRTDGVGMCTYTAKECG